MPEARRMSFPVFEDERGALLATEFADVPFAVRRVFTVGYSDRAIARGNHFVPCDQLLLLVSGRVTVHLGADDTSLNETFDLQQPGSAILVPMGLYIQYTLADSHSRVMVLASEPFSAAGEGS